MFSLNMVSYSMSFLLLSYLKFLNEGFPNLGFELGWTGFGLSLGGWGLGLGPGLDKNKKPCNTPIPDA